MATELSVRVGERIREAREAKGLTQGGLADLIGPPVNNQRVSEWERGIHKPNERNMKKIAAALDKPVAWFLEERPETNGTGDLLGVLSSADQLDRIEAMLRDVLGRLDAADPPTGPADVAEAAVRRRDAKRTPGATTRGRKPRSGKGG